MQKELLMPKRGVLCAWLKNEGDTVVAGEPVFEMETDKVVMQVEATDSGVLQRQLFDEGDDVAAESPVALIQTGEDNG